MAKTFSNWNQIEKYLKKEIDNILVNEVADHAKDEIQSALSTDLYDKYDPVSYKRRYYSGGGLGDKDTMTVKLVNSGEVTISPDAEPKYGDDAGGLDPNKSLAENLYFGYGNAEWQKPRPFMDKAKEDLRSDGSLKLVFVDALRDRGFEAQ
jgi:hypothetical protein